MVIGRYCPSCGAAQASATGRYCSECGKELPLPAAGGSAAAIPAPPRPVVKAKNNAPRNTLLFFGGAILLLIIVGSLSGGGSSSSSTKPTTAVATAAPVVQQVPEPPAKLAAPTTAPLPTAAPPIATSPPAPPTATPLPPATATPAISKLTNENWPLAISDANRYKEVSVSLVGKVFLDPQVTQDVVGLQIYTNKEMTDGNTVVLGPPAIVKAKKGDFIRVEGKVVDMFEGRNAFGATIKAPRVTASSLEILRREDVLAPAVKTYTVGKTTTQHGLSITLDRIELAERETRAYVKVSNKSGEKASVYSHSAKLVGQLS